MISSGVCLVLSVCWGLSALIIGYSIHDKNIVMGISATILLVATAVGTWIELTDVTKESRK